MIEKKPRTKLTPYPQHAEEIRLNEATLESDKA